MYTALVFSSAASCDKGYVTPRIRVYEGPLACMRATVIIQFGI
jgi:hypothetical protein